MIHSYYAQLISVTDYTAFGVALEGRTWSLPAQPIFEMYRPLEEGESISVTVNGTTHQLVYTAGSSIGDYLVQLKLGIVDYMECSVDGNTLIIYNTDPSLLQISCASDIGGFSGWGEGYRYGFQSQEIDNELWEGAITFKYRVEDPRLGRFFSVDPLGRQYAWNSSYAFSENRVLDSKELEGLEKVEYIVDGKVVETFRWDQVDRAAQEAFLRKHDIEGSFGSDYHPEDSQFSNANGNEIWRFYPTYCENTTGMLFKRYANEDALKSNNATSYNLSGVIHNVASFSYNDLNGSSDPGNRGDLTDKQARVLKNTAIIVGGVVAIVVTAGGATPGVISGAAATLEGFTIVSGSMAAAGGTAKMVMDLKGDFKNSDKVPTSYLGATVGSTLTVTTDNGKTVQYIKGCLTIAEGGLTFSWDKWGDVGNLASKAFTITNVTVDGDTQQAGSNFNQDVIQPILKK